MWTSTARILARRQCSSLSRRFLRVLFESLPTLPAEGRSRRDWRAGHLRPPPKTPRKTNCRASFTNQTVAKPPPHQPICNLRHSNSPGRPCRRRPRRLNQRSVRKTTHSKRCLANRSLTTLDVAQVGRARRSTWHSMFLVFCVRVHRDVFRAPKATRSSRVPSRERFIKYLRSLEILNRIDSKTCEMARRLDLRDLRCGESRKGSKSGTRLTRASIRVMF